MINKFLFVFLFISINVLADSIEFEFSKKIEPYLVSGNSGLELEKSFEKRPAFLLKKNVDGSTQWSYDLKVDFKTCEIKSFSAEIIYTLPRVDMKKTSIETAELFREYLSRLYEHEEIHCSITLKVLNDIYAKIKKGQNGNCKLVTKNIDKLLLSIKEINDQFDTYTNHGEIELAASPFGDELYRGDCKIDKSIFM